MMKYCLIILLLFITGCETPEEFPSSISDNKNIAAVEKIEAFIIKRFEKLAQSKNDFILYYSSVKKRTKGNRKWFESSKFVISEEKTSTIEIVRAYQKSPAGAYLSEQDNLYIKRLLKEKKQLQNNAFNQELSKIKRSDKLTDDDYNFTLNELGKIYSNIINVKSDIINFDQQQFDDISIELLKTIGSNNDLWKAIISMNKASVDELTKNKPLYSIVRPIISRVVFNSSKSLSDKDEIVLEVLNQAYTSYLFGYRKVTLSGNGVNAYITNKRLSELNSKVVSSLIKANNKEFRQ